MTISEARPLLEELESDRLLDDQDVVKEAIANVEESGIVFIDEIDKLVSSGDHRGADASSEGVQRDLLPLIEGSSIQTKHGNVNTDFILFIASGAFHSTKPSDLLAELQGRLPIRVTLKGLTQEDLHRILTEPVNNLLRQQTEMLKCENVDLNFTPEAVKEIARVTFETNKSVENIGARRLHTVIERVIEDISFDASSHQGEKIVVDEEYVKKRVGDLLTKSDLRKYIL
jgi:ATP-dependent HslUV protease ATP-binding subunit HslU